MSTSLVPGMRLYQSNRVERLIEALSDISALPVGGPLEPEWLVVESRGMGVWVSMQLAQRQEVWSNCHLLYPRAFIRRLLALALGQDGDADEPFARERLAWALFALLPTLLEHPAFEPLRYYLSGEHAQIKRFQLAQRLANMFDAYMIYRPAMVLQWEEGQDGEVGQTPNAWQPMLWRAVVARLGQQHTARRVRACAQLLAQRASGIADFPQRVLVFGTTSLPPLYLDLMQAAARHSAIYLFQLTPTPSSWGDLVHTSATSPRDRACPHTPGAPRDANPVLASLGLASAEAHTVLAALGQPLQHHTLYDPPHATTVLGLLHADIFHNVPRGTAADHLRVGIDAGDHSISIHACHSPMREVEILHTLLLEVLDRGIAPDDIVVMTPALDQYAPLIDAVFHRAPTDPQYLPYRIAGRSCWRERLVIEAFQRLLALGHARLTVSQVLDLLAIEPVHDQFSMTGDEVLLLTQWVTDCGIRWGIDKEHRRRHGQPAFHENTWRFGLERLLMGYATLGERHELSADVLPYDAIEGKEAELIGKLAEFSECLFRSLDTLHAAQPLGQWRDALGAMLAGIIAQTPDNSWQHQHIRATLQALVAHAEAAGCAEPVDLMVIRRLLHQSLQETTTSGAFLAGGVTFCDLLALRSIPFRVVCLVGMHHGVFPRGHMPDHFDMISHAPQAGDRSLRQEDRALFLDTLLAARERLIITYVGHSMADHRVSPPAVVVSELVDYLTAACDPPTLPPPEQTTPAAGEAARMAAVQHHLVLQHPLQPFNPRYFDGVEPRLYSYAERHCTGAQALIDAVRPPPPLFVTPLPDSRPREGQPRLALQELVRFFEHPTKYVLQRRLGVSLDDEELELQDREPIVLQPLERYQVGARLLDLHLDGVEAAHAWHVLRAAGCLPLGMPGKRHYHTLAEQVRPIAAAVRTHQDSERLANLPIHLCLDETLVTGTLQGLYSAWLLRYQYARVRAKHLLTAWVRHLVLCLCAPPGYPKESVLIGRPEQGGDVSVSRYTPVEASTAHAALHELLTLYWIGQREPLLLFPTSSMVFVQHLLQGASAEDPHADDTALDQARRAWEHGEGAESQDAYYRRVFVGHDPFEAGFSLFPAGPMAGGSFADLARRVYMPLLAHLRTAV